MKMTNEELLESAIDPEMLSSGESLAQVNPVKQAESVTNEKRAEMWSANASVNWQIIKGLTFKTSGSYNTTNNRMDIFYRDGSKEAYRNGEKPYGRTQMGRDVRWTNTNTLTWKDGWLHGFLSEASAHFLFLIPRFSTPFFTRLLYCIIFAFFSKAFKNHRFFSVFRLHHDVRIGRRTDRYFLV